MTELVQVVDEPWALTEANEQGGGSERARAIALEFAAAGKLHLCRFRQDEREEFLDIAWQESDDTRYLTPSECSRTLRSVATRVYEEYGSFDALEATAPLPGRLEPAWFAPCAQIAREGWDYSRWHRPWLVPANDGEKRFSRRTRLYVWEGVRSSLVLAFELLYGKAEWQPVEAVISQERP